MRLVIECDKDISELNIVFEGGGCGVVKSSSPNVDVLSGFSNLDKTANTTPISNGRPETVTRDNDLIDTEKFGVDSKSRDVKIDEDFASGEI